MRLALHIILMRKKGEQGERWGIVISLTLFYLSGNAHVSVASAVALCGNGKRYRFTSMVRTHVLRKTSDIYSLRSQFSIINRGIEEV